MEAARTGTGPAMRALVEALCKKTVATVSEAKRSKSLDGGITPYDSYSLTSYPPQTLSSETLHFSPSALQYHVYPSTPIQLPYSGSS